MNWFLAPSIAHPLKTAKNAFFDCLVFDRSNPSQALFWPFGSKWGGQGLTQVFDMQVGGSDPMGGGGPHLNSDDFEPFLSLEDRTEWEKGQKMAHHFPSTRF